MRFERIADVNPAKAAVTGPPAHRRGRR